MEDGTSDREGYLNRMLDRLFTLNDELAQMSPEEDRNGYAEKWRTIHHLKQEYKQMTGVYPNLPPYCHPRFREPGT